MEEVEVALIVIENVENTKSMCFHKVNKQHKHLNVHNISHLSRALRAE